jgi:hypothetical protein
MPRVRTSSSFLRFLVFLVFALLCTAGGVNAQGWDDESDDGWSSPPADSSPNYGSSYSAGAPPSSQWSLRAGLGFTHDPSNFLMNFELPYAFDQYISAGPMLHVGLEDDRLLIAPTANLTITVPDMPGSDFDRFHPNFFVGIGFAVIRNDDRAGDDRAAGFLIHTGVGVDYELSSRTAIGTRMFFNFLPEETLEEDFFYSWEVLGLKLSF